MPVAFDLRWILWPLAIYGAFVLLHRLIQALRRWPQRRARQPLASLLVVARNKERTIEGLVRGLAALGNATGAKVLEVIIVEDHSTDETAAIVERLARGLPAVRAVHMNEVGERHGSPLEVGVFMCSSPIVLLFNLEGRMHPRLLLRAAAQLLGSRSDETPTRAAAADPSTTTAATTIQRIGPGGSFQGKERA